MPLTAELVYFNGRGRAELIRLVLSACSIEFNEVHLETREQYLALKPELPFGQVPLLKIDGKDLVQTAAIVRYLARKHNLCGKDEDEKTMVDMYFEGTRDFYSPFLSVGFDFPLDKVIENMRGVVNKYLPLFERLLERNGSNGYLVGDCLTLADVGLLEPLLAIKDYYESQVFDNYPRITTFLNTVCSLPFFERYSGEIRKPTNSNEYVAHIREVFAM